MESVFLFLLYSVGSVILLAILFGVYNLVGLIVLASFKLYYKSLVWVLCPILACQVKLELMYRDYKDPEE